MLLSRNEFCDCGALERASRDPDHAIHWDEDLNEYFIAHGKAGRMMVYFCPHCGGRAPESRRRRLFLTPALEELQRLRKLTKSLQTVHDVIEALGEPEISKESAWMGTKPEGGGRPEMTQVCPVMIYTHLSDTAEVHMTIYPTGRVGISFHGKKAGPSSPGHGLKDGQGGKS